MKVVLCGPPHSGKSCLRQGLKEAFSQMPNTPYLYVITACPDGEGAWFNETASNHPELALSLKKNYKQEFTWEFTNKMAEDVAKCTLDFVLVDVGGRIDDKNQHICQSATHAIILSGSHEQFQPWEEFCQSLKLDIIARIESDYHGTEDKIDDTSNSVLTGSIHHLERGENLAQRPMIQALAQHLLDIHSSLT